MKLSDSFPDNHKNLLPFDGRVNYYGQLWTKEQADLYLNHLLENIEWRNEESLCLVER